MALLHTSSSRAAGRIKRVRSSLFKQFISLNNAIFSCFLETDYPQNSYLYERRLHIQKNKCLTYLMKLLDLSSRESSHFLYGEKIFSVMLDYASLRQRVSDHAVFLMCKEELLKILRAMNQVLWDAQQKTPNAAILLETNLEKLLEKIDSLENIYQNVLRVTAPDPMIFVLFINAIKLFEKGLRQCPFL